MRMITRSYFPFLLLLMASSGYAQHDSQRGRWDWSQPVQYQENHDPGMILLTDGQELQVGFTEIPWESVDQWQKGKPLLVGYKIGRGVVLFDPESGKSLQVLDGLGDKHPIDLLLAKCLSVDESTMGMVECYANSEKHWDAELNRAYQSLLGSLEEKHRVSLRRAQQQWLKFRDAERLAIGAIYDREGTMWRVVSARRWMAVTKDRAQTLAAYDTGW